MKQLKKSHNHSHFWIEDNIVCESYNTLRGLRYRQLTEVTMDDKEFLTEKDIKKVNEILSSK